MLVNSISSVSLSQIKDKEEYEDFEGVFIPKPGMALPYTFAVSSDNEGSLHIGEISIQLYDNHDDSVYFLDHLLE